MFVGIGWLVDSLVAWLVDWLVGSVDIKQDGGHGGSGVAP